MSDELFQILLVEDNEADIYLFRKGLENAEVNFELTVLTDGGAALSFVRREGKYAKSPEPDLAVMDLNLPKHDGIEVLEAFRQSRHLSNVPVVVMSSSTSPRERIRVERLGLEQYIPKPSDLDEVLRLGAVLKAILLKGKARVPPAGAP